MTVAAVVTCAFSNPVVRVRIDAVTNTTFDCDHARKPLILLSAPSSALNARHATKVVGVGKGRSSMRSFVPGPRRPAYRANRGR